MGMPAYQCKCEHWQSCFKCQPHLFDKKGNRLPPPLTPSERINILTDALNRIMIASSRRMAEGGDKLDYQDTNRQAGDIARTAIARAKGKA